MNSLPSEPHRVVKLLLSTLVYWSCQRVQDSMQPSGEDIHGHTHMGTCFGHRGTLRCSKAPAVLRSQGGREVPGRSLQQKDQFVLESQWQGRGVLPTGYEDAAANLPPNTHTHNLFLGQGPLGAGIRVSRAVYHSLCSQLALFNPSSATF